MSGFFRLITPVEMAWPVICRWAQTHSFPRQVSGVKLCQWELLYDKMGEN